MRQVLTAEQVRMAERAAQTAEPGLDLMAMAADVVASVASRVSPEGPVLVVVGPGNNGGDGLFAAARLAAQRPVLLWLAGRTAHQGGLEQAVRAGAQEVEALGAVRVLADCTLVIDAFTGIGARPGLPDEVATFAAACEAEGVPVLSVDLPSGLAADSATLQPSFKANHTVAFVAPKPCHVMAPAADRCGRIHLFDLGVQPQEGNLRQAEESDVAAWWPAPDASSHKYTRGVVTLDTGSESYPGAALLSASGALHAGAGMVRYTGRVASGLLLTRFPSVVIGDGRAEATVLGSGWGESETAASRVEWARLHQIAAVVDADALYALPAGRLDGWLLTPHAGELSRLLGCTRSHVESHPLECVREVARSTGATALLKGSTQYVAEPSGRVTIAVSGPAWTATAGSGDVLAGICGALLAAGLPAWRAGVLGASIQALTARDNPGPLTPDELAARLPQTIARLVAARG